MNNVLRMGFSRDGLRIVCRPLLTAIGRQSGASISLVIVAKTTQRCDQGSFWVGRRRTSAFDAEQPFRPLAQRAAANRRCSYPII